MNVRELWLAAQEKVSEGHGDMPVEIGLSSGFTLGVERLGYGYDIVKDDGDPEVVAIIVVGEE